MESITKMLEKQRNKRFNPSSRTPYPIMECHGCAHEAANECEKLQIHRPSGETSCMVCVRNPDLDPTMMKEIIAKNPEVALINSCLTFPADMYCTIDWLRILELYLNQMKRTTRVKEKWEC